ncbi:hypothetical protein FS749_000535 [Ceratobasidium sp. UAMH 11750]|nr:hypothetical protein FS749_000535 [Ceratobasidium sp. UAMH 11750]
MNEFMLADQFYGFLKQFYTVFPELVEKELYLTGQSYAGFYIPYIASRILHAGSSEKQELPLDLQSFLIVNGMYSSRIVSEEVPTAQFARKNWQLLGLSRTFVIGLRKRSEWCGYQDIIDAATYPPKGMIPLPNGNKDITESKCRLWDEFYQAVRKANPCFNMERVTDKCPTPAKNDGPYFSRPDVQKALHFDNFGTWYDCAKDPVFIGNSIVSKFQDDSPYSETLFPDLLQRLPKGFSLWNGLFDSIVFSEGTRITIQNLTWGGQQGFQTPITTPFVVGGNRYGVYHTERKLTYIQFDNAGHKIPQDQPAVSLHAFNWMLNGPRLYFEYSTGSRLKGSVEDWAPSERAIEDFDTIYGKYGTEEDEAWYRQKMNKPETTRKVGVGD